MKNPTEKCMETLNISRWLHTVYLSRASVYVVANESLLRIIIPSSWAMVTFFRAFAAFPLLSSWLSHYLPLFSVSLFLHLPKRGFMNVAVGNFSLIRTFAEHFLVSSHDRIFIHQTRFSVMCQRGL